MRLYIKAVLLVIGLLCFGLVSAQGEVERAAQELESLFQELPLKGVELVVEYQLPESGDSGAIVFSVLPNPNDLGDALEQFGKALEAAKKLAEEAKKFGEWFKETWNKIFKRGKSVTAQGSEFNNPGPIEIGIDGLLMIRHNGRISLNDFANGIGVLDYKVDESFTITFDPNARVQITTVDFRTDASLGDVLKGKYNIRGTMIPAGRYQVEDGVLMIPVR